MEINSLIISRVIHFLNLISKSLEAGKHFQVYSPQPRAHAHISSHPPKDLVPCPEGRAALHTGPASKNQDAAPPNAQGQHRGAAEPNPGDRPLPPPAVRLPPDGAGGGGGQETAKPGELKTEPAREYTDTVETSAGPGV